MAGNSSTINEKSRVSVGLIIIIISLILGGTASVWTVRAQVSAHEGNLDIHHSTAALDGKYAQQELMEARFDEVIRRLDRIERKLDQLK